MKKKIKALVNRLRSAVRQHPVEVVMSVVFSLAGCIHYESGYEYSFLVGPLVYFPVLFLATYTLNGLMRQKGTKGAVGLRVLYYLSTFFFILFLWMDDKAIWTPTYLVSLVVVQLVYLISGWKRDNDDFVRVALRYLKAVLSAGLLAGIAYLLAISVNASVRYIFEIWEDSYRWFYTEAAYLIFICGMSLLFLMFNQEKEERDEGSNRLFEVLLNYVLSPVLLIYAVILYLYFIKVAVLWSLPKGAVAYIVVSFISATFVLKGCQVFLSKRYYDWFYKQASWVVLPALAMYWIGTYYRINQYGFTEPRVYLVAVGGILTGLVVLFLTKRWGRYLYAACLAVVLLSAVTYIPGITAKDIERISQEGRENDPGNERGYDRNSYMQIDNKYPLDLSGYRTLVPVTGYKNDDCMYAVNSNDTLRLFGKNDEVLYTKDIPSFWEGQLKNAGVNPSDTIPESAYPDLLVLDMDSAKLVFQSIHLYRPSADSAYTVSYMIPSFYLEKKK